MSSAYKYHDKDIAILLLYGKHPHLLGDVNKALPNDATAEGHEQRLCLVESARTEALKATYERAVRDKNVRDELVRPHDLDAGQWVLVKHENPQKFESKWFGPYQIVEKMILGTYRLQDPNGRELAALVHGNRLIPAAVSGMDELRELWASPKTKDALRRQNIRAEWVPASPENADALEQHLLEADVDDPPPLQAAVPQDPNCQKKDEEAPRFILRIPVKRTLESAALEGALNSPRKRYGKRHRNTTPSRT